MQIQRIVSILLFVFILMIYSVSPAWAGPDVVGKAAILIDSKSGKILYAKNAHEPLPPASTTKILTGILTLEKAELSDMVTAGKNATLVEPSAIGLKEGERISVENHVYAILLKSANDSAIALAEHISGSVSEFAELMNSSARAWGATNSNFTNPNGLPDPNHRSTAHDLAYIAKHAMENPKFREFVSTKVKVIPRDDDDGIKWLQNHNKMLWRYEGATGIKTGYTRAAQQCLVASAEKNGQELIAVVLGSQGANVWSDAESLAVKSVEVIKGTEKVSLVTQEEFFYTLPKGEPKTLTEKVVVNTDITAPINKGQVLGKLAFLLNGREIGSVNLVAGNDVTVRKLPVIAEDAKSFVPLIIGGVLLAVFIIWNIRMRRRRKRRRRVWQNRVIR